MTCQNVCMQVCTNNLQLMVIECIQKLQKSFSYLMYGVSNMNNCCHFIYRLPSNCHHSQRHKHKCHFGACPPCQLICGKVLSCSHVCPVKCHSAVLTKIEMKEVCISNSFKYIICFTIQNLIKYSSKVVAT